MATSDIAMSLHPDLVFTLGDEQYERGEAAGFTDSFAASWGRLKASIRPVPGNHEYAGGKADGYYGYFGDAAHGPSGWYSFDAGAWHVIGLNSVCSVVGCAEGSDEVRWLKADLAAHASDRCVLAMWHHPRYSSGLHGSTDDMAAIWQALSDAQADVVLSGHDHHYERFAPQGGVQQFVAGTGGRSLYPVVNKISESEFIDHGHFGVLELELRARSYAWSFHRIDGTVEDAGSATCR